MTDIYNAPGPAPGRSGGSCLILRATGIATIPIFQKKKQRPKELEKLAPSPNEKVYESFQIQVTEVPNSCLLCAQ